MTVVYRDDAQAGHAALQTPGTRVSRTPVVVALAFTAVGVAVASVLTTFLVVHAHHGVARFAARVIPCSCGSRRSLNFARDRLSHCLVPRGCGACECA